MLWLIVLLVVIFLVFGVAGLRNALKVGAALLVICILLVGGYLLNQNQEQEASKKRISASEVRFDDLRLSVNGSTSRLTGNIRNQSPRYPLTSIELEITLRDCVESKCDVVGQTKETLW